jgi:hypothetical protein
VANNSLSRLRSSKRLLEEPTVVETIWCQAGGLLSLRDPDNNVRATRRRRRRTNRRVGRATTSAPRIICKTAERTSSRFCFFGSTLLEQGTGGLTPLFPIARFDEVRFECALSELDDRFVQDLNPVFFELNTVAREPGKQLLTVPERNPERAAARV